MATAQSQLVMVMEDLDKLSIVQLPIGFSCRTFQAGDELYWQTIIFDAFETNSMSFNVMSDDPEFHPQRIWFICDHDLPIATASGWFKADFGDDTGYLHMVGVSSQYKGKKLGAIASLLAMHGMHAEGRRKAVLNTDDFRLPAIKTYLSIGYKPCLTDDSHLERWHQVAEQLGENYKMIIFNSL